MKILVLSDSHGDVFSCKMAIASQKNVDAIIHLGDGEEDLDGLKKEIGNKKTFRLQGNSYYSSSYGCPKNLCVKFEGLTTFMCHGHEYYVKNGIEKLVTAAENLKCNIALYGHTHIQNYRLLDDIHTINPGSVKDGKFAVLDIDNKNIKVELKSLLNI